MGAHLKPRTSNRALGVPALALQREHRRRLGVLGSVLDVINAHCLVRARSRDEGAVWLLHDHGRPTVVVLGLPDNEAAMFWLVHGRRAPPTPRSVGALQMRRIVIADPCRPDDPSSVALGVCPSNRL